MKNMVFDFEIKKIGANEAEKISHLYRLSFGRERDPAFFRWKYFENPAGDALCMAAFHGAEVLGSCVMIPEDFFVFGDKLKIYKCCDLMVSPWHRKKGISTSMVSSLVENLRQNGPLFLYTLCGKNATGGFLRNRWSMLDGVGYYFLHKCQFRVKRLFSDPGRLYEKGILRKIDSIADLCKNYNFDIDRSKIHNARSRRYLEWRLGNPHYSYAITGYFEAGAMAGYVICNDSAGSNTYIIDLQAYKNDPRVIGALLTGVESAAYSSGKRMVMALAVKKTVFQRRLRRNMYFNNPFHKGPLSSLLDFNILIDNVHPSRAREQANWDLLSLNYDDI